MSYPAKPVRLAGPKGGCVMRHITRVLWVSVALLLGWALPGTSAPAQAQGGQTLGGKTELLWLGQSAFRITTPGGKVILIDPFITQNPKTPAAWKDLGRLGKIDVVLVSHGHGDHFGDAATIVNAQNIQMWGPAGLADTRVEVGLRNTVV